MHTRHVNLQISSDATGIIGETFVATKDVNGHAIMTGMEAIRGQQEDCEFRLRPNISSIHVTGSIVCRTFITI